MPQKVLVVEDSQLLHRMFDMILARGPGFQVVHAMNGKDGLDKLAENPDVEVILLDINMPQMNGLEFLGKIQAEPQLRTIPVIIVSTEGKEEDILRGLKAGARAYLKKPFQAQDLLQVIEKVREVKPQE
jgi:two-component system, chemotaxis family, chemotaxis protein CheY